MLSPLARRWVGLLLAFASSLLLVVGCEPDSPEGGFTLDIDASGIDASFDNFVPPSADAGNDLNVPPGDAGVDQEIPAQVFDVGGTVTGLDGAMGLVLQLNGANDLPIANDGVFAFPTQLANEASYSVTIGTQPANKTCNVSAGSGKIQNAHVTGIVVNCASNAFTVGGTITGLAPGASVALLNNGGNALVRDANGSFAFTMPIPTTQTYAVTVSIHPANPLQVCTVTNGSGTMGSENVTNVLVTCVTSKFTVGGTVSGLAGGSVTLQNNAGDNVTVSANTSFTFASSVESGANYAVTVLAHPSNPTQTCTVTNGSGKITNANVANVAVTCTTSSFTVGGTLIGLNAGNQIVLQNNKGDNLTLGADGPFTFATPVLSGNGYDVTILTQPNAQVCNVSAGSGKVGGGNVTTVTVNCGNTYTVGGTVSGLVGGTLTLANNGTFDTVNVTQSGSFAFPKPLAPDATYAVTVQTHPSNPSQTCTIVNGSGKIGAANVTNVAVTCTTNVYKLGGVVSGLASGQSVQLKNGANTATISANGDFAFPTGVPSGSTYEVTVSQQPLSPIKQTCIVTNGSGSVGAADISNIQVTCTADTFFVGGTLTGLAKGATLVLQNNKSNNLTLTQNGEFKFTTKIASGQPYSVTVLTNPGTPTQTCSVASGSGTVGGADVNSVIVRCSTSSFTVGGTLTGMDVSQKNSVVITNNGENLTLTENGSFTFANPVLSGTSYAVTVTTNPQNPVQTCNVSAGSGTMGGANVTSVVVNCATNTFSVGGTITGLGAGNTVVLQNNTGDDLAVTANGSFAFKTPIASGAPYSVTVLTSPTSPISQTCAITNNSGNGIVGNAPVTSVTVECKTKSFKVGGTLSGLAKGNILIVRNNGADDLVLKGDGAFVFSTPIPSGNTFDVTAVDTDKNPIQQKCAVTAGTGTIGNADYTDAKIECVTVQYKLSGTVFGLEKGPIQLLNNKTDSVDLTSNGSYSFKMPVDNGSPYDVVIVKQPSGSKQLCVVHNASGTMPKADVKNVDVYCGVSCNSLKTTNPELQTGTYEIDPDGVGPITPFSAWCDMAWAGGGWTLAQVTVAPNGPSQGQQGLVTIGKPGYLAPNVVVALANVSTQIHVRSPGKLPTNPTAWVSSTANTVPIKNLRRGKILNYEVPFGGGAGYIGRSYWIISGAAPTADAVLFDYSCASTKIENWPNVYWACGNEKGWQLYDSTTSWNESLKTEHSMEVYAK